MNPISKAWWIAKGVGWDNVPRRIYQAAIKRTGILQKRTHSSQYVELKRRFLNRSVTATTERWQERRSRFFPLCTSTQLRNLVSPEQWQKEVGVECEQAISGHYPFFSGWKAELGWPPNFNFDPVNRIQWPVGEHWLATARSGPPRNDIKLVWEASRFSAAYTFARHYVYTGQECWADAFWDMYDAWREQNPVNLSVAWGCGQEVAFRLMAVLFACVATLDSSAATLQRLEDIELFCWQSAKRIAANINYAISQENNHALSEATGLLTVGLLFPELCESAKWLKSGKRVLESEVRRQIYDDGSYVQNSMSYHRVMLDVMSWAIQLANINQQPLSSQCIERVGKAASWLSEFMNTVDGRVPNYGANDGANILPLSCADYLDYRPTLQSAASITHNSDIWLGDGPWCEKTSWLCGDVVRPSYAERNKKTANAKPRENWCASTGGYYILRGPNSYLMTRATRFLDRPSQCDMLHVDVWYRGQNILRDTGSFYYYHNDPSVKNYFYSVKSHNTIQVAEQEQMIKGPNFLWFHWPTANAELGEDGRLDCQAQFFCRLPYTHRRQISRKNDVYRIHDSVLGADRYTARWHLTPEWRWSKTGPQELTGQSAAGRYTIRFETTHPVACELTFGWESLYYGQRSQIPVAVVRDIAGELETILEPTWD